MQAKKVASHLKKHSGGHGYTDQDNPFGDSNVTERFVWSKKLEKQIQSGVDVKDLGAKAEKRRQEERLVRAHATGPMMVYKTAYQGLHYLQQRLRMCLLEPHACAVQRG